MKRYTFTMLEEHRAKLQSLILRDQNESGAILQCGRSSHLDPWSGLQEERFLCREVIEIPDSAYAYRSPVRMTWSTTPFYDQLKRVERYGDAVAVVHSHPNGPLKFSSLDDIADQETFGIAFGRLDSDRPHFSAIMDADGELVARVYETDLKPREMDVVRIIGERWKFRCADPAQTPIPVEFDRQVRAFGAAATRDLSQLRIGIVGCGGTGSAVAMLLARMGARRLALVDSDYVDETSLNRLHFSGRADASLRERKVDVVARGIANIGLSTSIIRIASTADSTEAARALRACDIIFGCTDDHLGRNLLNRLAFFYLVPVIDTGLLIEPANADGYDVFDGRVTVIQPGYPCQVCRKLISTDEMHTEGLRRNDPTLHALYRRAGYVPSGGDPSPVVVTFTTEVATMAVNELLQRLTGFRGRDGSASERVRRFDQSKDFELTPAGQSRAQCKLCALRRYDGRGDMNPYLDQSA